MKYVNLNHSWVSEGGAVPFRINKKRHASTWSLQVLNALGSEEFYGYDYNYKEDRIEESTVRVVVTIFGRPTPVDLKYWEVEAV